MRKPIFPGWLVGSLLLSVCLATVAVELTAPNVLLKIKRSGCYVDCPAYEITLSTKGEVRYLVREYAIHQDLKKAVVSKDIVAQFAHALGEHKFFERKSCMPDIYDSPILTLTANRADETHTVEFFPYDCKELADLNRLALELEKWQLVPSRINA
jgi:hypothetical protein